MHHSPFKLHGSQKTFPVLCHAMLLDALQHLLKVSGPDRKHPPHSEWSHRRRIVPSGVALRTALFKLRKAALTAHLSRIVQPSYDRKDLVSVLQIRPLHLRFRKPRRGVHSKQDEISNPSFELFWCSSCSCLHTCIQAPVLGGLNVIPARRALISLVTPQCCCLPSTSASERFQMHPMVAVPRLRPERQASAWSASRLAGCQRTMQAACTVKLFGHTQTVVCC